MNPNDASYQPSTDLPTPQMPGFKAVDAPNQNLINEPPLTPQSVNPIVGAQQAPIDEPPVITQPDPAANPVIQVPVIDDISAADDADLIEKEWVNKAKEIVRRTKEDPRQQNIEMNKFKAGYIQKRYNKQIKTNDR